MKALIHVNNLETLKAHTISEQQNNIYQMVLITQTYPAKSKFNPNSYLMNFGLSKVVSGCTGYPDFWLLVHFLKGVKLENACCLHLIWSTSYV